MVQRFQGPYSQPKTARSRVPNTSGGRVPPTPPNQRIGPMGVPRGFRGRMSPRPSLAAMSWARAMGRFSRAMGPWGGAGAFAFSVGMHRFNAWYSVVDPNSQGSYDLTGWTVHCTSTKLPIEVCHKFGSNPGFGAGDVVSNNCTTGSNIANRAWGATIPAGSTLFQEVWQGVQASTGQCWPLTTLPQGRSGRIVLRATYAGGSPAPIPWVPGKIVLPAPDDLPFTEARPQPQPSTAGRGGFQFPYENEAVTVVISRPRDDGSESENTRPRTRPRPGQGVRPVPGSGGGIVVDDTPHTNLPPPPGDREAKARTPLGKTTAELRRQYGKLTEVQDVVKCLEKALPRGHPCRRLGRGLDERASCLIAHADDIDLGAAARCIAADQVTDAVIGKLSRGASRNLQRSPYTPKRPYPLGPLTGGFGARMR